MDGQTALTTAVIAATVALAVAGVANAVSLFAGWRQRKHERSLARAEREYQRRADAYLEAMTLINHGMDWVERTMPVIGPGPEPPPPIGDETLRRANSLLALFGSDGTRDLMRQLGKAQREFSLNVEAHEDAKAEGRAYGDHDDWGSWRRIEDTRAECRRLRGLVEQSMRADLGRE